MNAAKEADPIAAAIAEEREACASIAEIMEFEARFRDVSWSEQGEGSELRLPATIARSVRYGSIYDREGSD